MLPAWAVRWARDDPRRIPYLLIWKSGRDDTVKEAVRVARVVPKPNLPEADSVTVKRADGSVTPVFLAWRQMTQGAAARFCVAGDARSQAGRSTALKSRMSVVIT